MSLNKTPRKRCLPEWMKSSQSSSASRGKLSPNPKPKGPSYPPISVKKIKKLQKPLDRSVTLTDEEDTCDVTEIFSMKQKGNVNKTPERTDLSSKPILQSPFSESESEPNDLFLTVEELTRVAQEVIDEELQKRKMSLFNLKNKKCL